VDHHHISAAALTDDQTGFTSRSFLIRYCEEEIEINDIGLFRAELDVEPDYLNTDFYLEVELFFSDLSLIGGPDKWQSQTVADFETKAVFKSVSLQKFVLHRLPQGLNEFVQVVFDDQYYSSLNCTVEATLVDFRFRARPQKSLDT